MKQTLPELLAPAGDLARLNTALHFGADAVYCGGKDFGLRAGAKNFDAEGLLGAVRIAHAAGKKLYVTANIFAHDHDFEKLPEFLQMLQEAKADAVIVSDPGILQFVKERTDLQIHLSTQANTTNRYSAKFWAEQGVSRIVLARETTLAEIAKIRDALPEEVELEAFVHGAMCIAYSGRCLLSNLLTGRDANRGDCVQACRWEYEIHEISRDAQKLTIGEDGRGTYLLNSKDLNMIRHLGALQAAGVTSFKVEGRMKTSFYVGTVINAYRRAMDLLDRESAALPEWIPCELDKTSHREYTTGFYFEERDSVCLHTSKPVSDYKFIAEVLGYDEERGCLIVEQRNRFKVGEMLEILSADTNYINQMILVEEISDAEGNRIDDAKNVCEVLYIRTDIRLTRHDILRRKEG